MSRETRANLIFLAVFVALCLPGAIKIFQKKMQPGAKPIDMRDPVRRSLPYMDPQPTPDTFPRVEPAETRIWVNGLASEIAGADLRRIRGMLPHISDNRRFELLYMVQHEGHCRAGLLVWDSPLAAATDTQAAALVEGSLRQARIVRTLSRDLPPIVRKELQDAGFIDPPRRVSLLAIEVDGSDVVNHVTKWSLSATVEGTTRQDVLTAR